MYIDYSNLWKMLVEKSISKTEFMQLTGISSRVLAKLSKNQTVTTDTIARICTVLHCDVSDIMKCVEEDMMSLYNFYRKFGKITEENDNYKTVVFERNSIQYCLYITQKKAAKNTHIHCKADGTVYREDLYPFGSMSSPSCVESVIIKPIPNKNKVQIVIISGKPATITGLDEGIFVSASGRKKENCIYVMSETAFKLFEV